MKKTTLLCSALLCVLSLAGCAAMLASMDEAFACSDPLSLDCSIARQKANDARAAQQRYEQELEDSGEHCETYEVDGELVEDCWYDYSEPQKPAIDPY